MVHCRSTVGLQSVGRNNQGPKRTKSILGFDRRRIDQYNADDIPMCVIGSRDSYELLLGIYCDFVADVW